MDRNDFPSDEYIEKQDEECMDMVGRAITNRDKEWFDMMDFLVNEMVEQKKEMHVGTLDRMISNHVYAFNKLKEKMS